MTDEVQAWRKSRIIGELNKSDCDAVILYDPINIRYACGSRNMQVWTMHNYCRYLLMTSDGRVILFELPSSAHLSAHNEWVDEIQPSLAWDYMMVGDRGDEMAERWAVSILDTFADRPKDRLRIAIDRADLSACRALQKLGVEPIDGKPLMEQARCIKSVAEIEALTASLRTCEAAVSEMRHRLTPGMKESEALSILIRHSIELGGEYPETRLLSSGPRTNPWFQETTDRAMQAGELISFDTDLIGPGGFYNDISRSWIVGEDKPTDEQRKTYELAFNQLQHNIDLLRPGISFLEYSDKAFQLPDAYIKNRYADVAHGCGLGVEYPLIWYREDAKWGAYDGCFQRDMVVCVEAYVGHEHGGEGVKLEQPVWITESGPKLLSEYPLEEDYL